MDVHLSPILNPPPPSSPSHPSGLPQRTGFECHVSCIELGLVIYFSYGNIHISILFSHIMPPSPSPTESKSLFFISVSLLLFDFFLLNYSQSIIFQVYSRVTQPYIAIYIYTHTHTNSYIYSLSDSPPL